VMRTATPTMRFPHPPLGREEASKRTLCGKPHACEVSGTPTAYPVARDINGGGGLFTVPASDESSEGRCVWLE
jgi:hypothetical protein